MFRADDIVGVVILYKLEVQPFTRPSDLAVLRLIINSYLAAACTRQMGGLLAFENMIDGPSPVPLCPAF